MYIEIYKKSKTTKGIKVNKLTYNADDLLYEISNNRITTYNKEDFINGLKKKIYDETFSEVRLDSKNVIECVKKFAEVLKSEFNLTENVDFKIVSDFTWNTGGLKLPIRITIPQYIIFKTPVYLNLVSHVQYLITQDRAKYDIVGDLVVMYFIGLLSEHQALLEKDLNVLIEYQS